MPLFLGYYHWFKKGFPSAAALAMTSPIAGSGKKFLDDHGNI